MTIAVVYLDATPLGLLSQLISSSPTVDACHEWFYRLLNNSIRVVIPEITDYEVRRELIRTANKKGVARLTALRSEAEYLPITTTAMERAAELWADARNTGRATADKHSLDCDVVLAAQALTDVEAFSLQPDEYVIATINVRHLARYANAALWQDITV